MVKIRSTSALLDGIPHDGGPRLTPPVSGRGSRLKLLEAAHEVHRVELERSPRGRFSAHSGVST